MPLKPGQVVTINFTLKDKEGNILDQTTADEPFNFISGQEQVLPKLEEKLGTMLIGSKSTLNLEPVDGYGEVSESAIQVVTRNQFPEGTELAEGMEFIANSPDGNQMPFVVKKVEEENVTLDFNHPLAGKALEFDVELLNLRDASKEEMEHGHVHGIHGHTY